MIIPFLGKLTVERHCPYGHAVAHSPKTWPWWKLFAIKPVRTNPHNARKAGIHSFNVWFYTRSDAVCVWVCFACNAT